MFCIGNEIVSHHQHEDSGRAINFVLPNVATHCRNPELNCCARRRLSVKESRLKAEHGFCSVFRFIYGRDINCTYKFDCLLLEEHTCNCPGFEKSCRISIFNWFWFSLFECPLKRWRRGVLGRGCQLAGRMLYLKWTFHTHGTEWYQFVFKRLSQQWWGIHPVVKHVGLTAEVVYHRWARQSVLMALLGFKLSDPVNGCSEVGSQSKSAKGWTHWPLGGKELLYPCQ